MGTKTKQQEFTVRVPGDTRAPDWAWHRARNMHASLADACDRATGQERDRLLAELERLADREQRRQEQLAARQAKRAGHIAA